VAALGEVFFRSGSLVFGGGHVVLPLLHDALVPAGWISNNDFLTGYGAAQALPGPLFAVSAYFGAVSAPPGLAALGAAVAVLCIFLPGMVLAVAGRSLWQRLARAPRARAALAGVNAGAVGILAAALYNPVLTGALQPLVLR
jgi:chromate transporter